MRVNIDRSASEAHLLLAAAGDYWNALRAAFLSSTDSDPGDEEFYATWSQLPEESQNVIAGTLSFAILEAGVNPDSRVRA